MNPPRKLVIIRGGKLSLRSAAKTTSFYRRGCIMPTKHRWNPGGEMCKTIRIRRRFANVPPPFFASVGIRLENAGVPPEHSYSGRPTFSTILQVSKIAHYSTNVAIFHFIILEIGNPVFWNVNYSICAMPQYFKVARIEDDNLSCCLKSVSCSAFIPSIEIPPTTALRKE